MGAQRKDCIYSLREALTMKFWLLMGFITTGGPAVRGHALNFFSVASSHSLFETVEGVLPKVETPFVIEPPETVTKN